MNLFDKICAVGAFAIGVVFIILGGLGLFLGCSANFTLPPILGVVPFFVGWGIIKPIMVAWRVKRPRPIITQTNPFQNLSSDSIEKRQSDINNGSV